MDLLHLARAGHQESSRGPITCIEQCVVEFASLADATVAAANQVVGAEQIPVRLSPVRLCF